jgi:hypothetical protein
MSAEGIFLAHYMDSLYRLQNTWLNSGDADRIDQVRFDLQVEYLIRLIPKKDVRDEIYAEFSMELKKYKDDPLANQKAGLAVVTKMIEFIVGSFDLLHIDIIGPAVVGQYNPDLEVPEWKPEVELD